MNIPILRLGREYTSYDLVELNLGGGETLTTHTANPGLSRRDASEKPGCIDHQIVIR